MGKALSIKQKEKAILSVLEENQQLSPEEEGYQRIVIADKENHHYQLLATGWATPNHFVNTLLIHFQIKPDGSIWLLENNTELHVTDELANRGIPKSEIVLAFHPPQYRAMAGMA